MLVLLMNIGERLAQLDQIGRDAGPRVFKVEGVDPLALGLRPGQFQGRYEGVARAPANLPCPAHDSPKVVLHWFIPLSLLVPGAGWRYLLRRLLRLFRIRSPSCLAFLSGLRPSSALAGPCGLGFFPYRGYSIAY